MFSHTRTSTLLLTAAFLVLVGACANPPEAPFSAPLSALSQAQSERVPVRQASTAAVSDSVGTYLQTQLQDQDFTAQVKSEAVQKGLTTFYENRQFEPAWMEGGTLSAHAEVLIADLCHAEEVALLPADYQLDLLREALAQATNDLTPAAAAALDLQLTRVFMLYADDLMAGRIDPQVLSSEVYLERPEVDLNAVLANALGRPAPDSFSESMQPEHPHYARLREALDHYRQLAEDGGWPTIEVNDVLEPGMPSAAVPALRQRLAITGDFDAAHVPQDSLQQDSVYSEHIAAAVARFQARHGLLVDSLVGPSTQAALNVSVEDRIRQIERNFERWRWLPRDLGERYVLVNIPAFTVYGYDAGQQALSMRVVVGSEYGGRETPVFSDRMERVVFRPFWNLPQGIAANEVVPKARQDASYLTRNGYEIIAGNDIVPASEEALDKVAEGTYRMRQQPGPSNALGLVKFLFPNRHAIYLHDTPSDHLFAEYERDFSHGCIRLEDPPRFGEFVLGPEGWDLDRINAAINTGDRQDVQLDHPFPVYIMYLTAFGHDDGTVSFYDDIYGFDEALEEALTQRTARAKTAAADRAETTCQALAQFKAKI